MFYLGKSHSDEKLAVVNGIEDERSVIFREWGNREVKEREGEGILKLALIAVCLGICNTKETSWNLGGRSFCVERNNV